MRKTFFLLSFFVCFCSFDPVLILTPVIGELFPVRQGTTECELVKRVFVVVIVVVGALAVS